MSSSRNPLNDTRPVVANYRLLKDSHSHIPDINVISVRYDRSGKAAANPIVKLWLTAPQELPTLSQS